MSSDIELLARSLGVQLRDPSASRADAAVYDVLQRVVALGERQQEQRSNYTGLVLDKGLVQSGQMLTHHARTFETRELTEPRGCDLASMGMQPVSFRTHLLHWRSLGFLSNGVEVCVWTAQRGLSTMELTNKLVYAASERLIAGGSMRAAYELCDRIEKDLHRDRP